MLVAGGLYVEGQAGVPSESCVNRGTLSAAQGPGGLICFMQLVEHLPITSWSDAHFKTNTDSLLDEWTDKRNKRGCEYF